MAGVTAASDPMILLPIFTRVLLVRSLSIWVVIRLLVAFANADAASSLGTDLTRPFWQLQPVARTVLVLAVVAAAWAWSRIDRLERFLLFLGYRRIQLLATILIPPLLAEAVLMLAS